MELKRALCGWARIRGGRLLRVGPGGCTAGCRMLDPEVLPLLHRDFQASGLELEKAVSTPPHTHTHT